MRRLPGPLAVLIVMTAVNALIALPVDTIGSRFGGIPQEIPAFGLPELSLSTLGKLIAPAITIALLGVYAVIAATNLLITVALFIVINLLVDLSYTLLNPRLRHG